MGKFLSSLALARSTAINNRRSRRRRTKMSVMTFFNERLKKCEQPAALVHLAAVSNEQESIGFLAPYINTASMTLYQESASRDGRAAEAREPVPKLGGCSTGISLC